MSRTAHSVSTIASPRPLSELDAPGPDARSSIRSWRTVARVADSRDQASWFGGASWPREGQLLAVPIPGVPAPHGHAADPAPVGTPARLPAARARRAAERASSSMLEETSRPLAKDQTEAARLRGARLRSSARAAAAPPRPARPLGDLQGHLAARSQRPDFNSFMKKGDERLPGCSEQVDRLPDLQSDFTNNQYKMVFRKSKALTGGLRPDQISPQKLRASRGDGAARSQGRRQLERRRAWRAWRRSRGPARPRPHAMQGSGQDAGDG